METGAGNGLYPLHSYKIIHLVRHAQGIHNVEGSAYSKQSPEMFDAQLSSLGWVQVENLRKDVEESGLMKRIELVIVSPLLRTLQTATGVFGAGNVRDEMVEETNSLNYPPFLAVELCRERLGVNTCDKRSSVTEYKNLFPAIDFSLLETNEDNLWIPDVRESDEDLAARGIKFMNWLWTRKEKEIAIVTHSAFLLHTLEKFGNDCHPFVKSEMCKFFGNCELRSMLLADKSLTASDGNGK